MNYNPAGQMPYAGQGAVGQALCTPSQLLKDGPALRGRLQCIREVLQKAHSVITDAENAIGICQPPSTVSAQPEGPLTVESLVGDIDALVNGLDRRISELASRL